MQTLRDRTERSEFPRTDLDPYCKTCLPIDISIPNLKFEIRLKAGPCSTETLAELVGWKRCPFEAVGRSQGSVLEGASVEVAHVLCREGRARGKT